MLVHIVKNGESINDILNLYNLEFEEIRNSNLHITDFYHLITGMKIKIPLINKEVEQILEKTESFVQKYYPQLNELVEEIEDKNITYEEDHHPEEKEIEPFKQNLRAYPGILPPRKPYKRF